MGETLYYLIKHMVNLDMLYTEIPILFIPQGNERAILVSQKGDSPRRVLGNQPACHSHSLDGILTKMTSLSQQAALVPGRLGCHNQ